MYTVICCDVISCHHCNNEISKLGGVCEAPTILVDKDKKCTRFIDSENEQGNAPDEKPMRPRTTQE